MDEPLELSNDPDEQRSAADDQTDDHFRMGC
jgi:hypothetical protein